MKVLSIIIVINVFGFGFILNLMYKTNTKIHRKIRHFSYKPELDKEFKEEIKEIRKN